MIRETHPISFEATCQREQCGKTFTSHFVGTKYCKIACRDLVYRARKPRRKKPKKKKICRCCKKTFFVGRDLHQRITCGDECYEKQRHLMSKKAKARKRRNVEMQAKRHAGYREKKRLAAEKAMFDVVKFD